MVMRGLYLLFYIALWPLSHILLPMPAMLKIEESWVRGIYSVAAMILVQAAILAVGLHLH